MIDFRETITLKRRKTTLENPIVNNRIVSSMHFAIRFKNFVESVTTSDACGEEEKETMLAIANRLLEYQLATVDLEDEYDKDEIEYLSRIGLFPIQPLFKTEDGFDVFESSKGTDLYGLILEIKNQSQISKCNIKNQSDIDMMNPKRVWFLKKDNAEEFLKLNKKSYSIQDLRDLEVYELIENLKRKKTKLS